MKMMSKSSRLLAQAPTFSPLPLQAGLKCAGLCNVAQKGRLTVMKRRNQERRELIEFLFQRPELFQALLSPRRFWDAVYQFAEGTRPEQQKAR